MQISVIIPIYNERRWIAEVLARVLAVDVDKQVVVVDGSTDGTADGFRSGRPARVRSERLPAAVAATSNRN